MLTHSDHTLELNSVSSLHAAESFVGEYLDQLPSGIALYQLSIADNGSCPEKIDESGMGLANMRERAASLNGNINITSGSKGFCIFLSVPKQNLTERRS